MKSLLLSLGVFAFSLAAHADFTGVWNGTGQLAMSGTTTDCTAMQIDINHQADKFILNSSTYDCGSEHIRFEETVLEIVNGSLVYEGQTLGTVTDSEVHISASSESEYELHMVIGDGGAMSYSETVGIDDAGNPIVMSGTLTR